ncbi:MAG: site-specific DNA-methyltransferase [Candidatus Cloacimonetes bacterium]|nr:site-specific DNA-methyltransferase [Candidatus Cloacimonadota bacterium]
MDEIKMDGKSMDLTKENIERMKELFPEIVTEGKVDFDKLKTILGIEVDNNTERYNFTWYGKSQAIRLSQLSSMGTLRPCKEKSVNYDNTNNIYVEGDNLEVLKLLQKSYFGKIKMIYIDPPYNTGEDFVYKDDFTNGISNYIQQTKQIEENGKKISTNVETDGHFHTNWLNMMYPRLKLARNLLTDDGVMFISIDDNEIENLKKICIEIFGSNNELSTLIWNKQHSQQQGIFKKYHEYVLVFCKNIEEISNIKGGEGIIEAGALKKISKSNPASEFTFPAGVRFEAKDGTKIIGTFGDSEKVTVTQGVMECKNGVLVNPVTLYAGWTQKDQMLKYFYGEKPVYDSKGQKILEFYFNSSGKLKCNKERSSITPPSILPEYGMVSKQTEDLAKLMGGHYFDNPKPVEMIKDFANWFTTDDDYIMDFFGGSSTTAHAIMKLNSEDGGKRKFIIVQWPEICASDKEAAKAGYHNICEIGEERIRRAGSEITKSITETNKQQSLDGTSCTIPDTGFRVYSLDTSNIKLWAPNGGDLNQTLKNYIDNLVVSDRSDYDVLNEIILKLGLELTTSIEMIDGVESLYSVGSGALMIYLGDVKSMDIAEAMIKSYKENEPSIWKVVFKDNGFASDDIKANTRETLRAAGLQDGSFVTL